MAIILDADVIIRGERGTFDLAKWVADRPDEEFEVAAITVAELWHGVERATDANKATREQYLQSLLSVLPVISYGEITAFHHARIRAASESSGTMMNYYDLIVAATALERGSSVATFNHRHFAHVQGLKVIQPQ